MTDAPATNELLALADRISATPSYTGKDLRTWRTPILERCDGDGDGNAVSVILVDAKQREVLVKALRAAASPSAEVSVESTTRLADAMWQLLDDMGASGQSVCLAAKAEARIAYEPFRNKSEDFKDWMSLEAAQRILKESEQ